MQFVQIALVYHYRDTPTRLKYMATYVCVYICPYVCMDMCSYSGFTVSIWLVMKVI